MPRNGQVDRRTLIAMAAVFAGYFVGAKIGVALTFQPHPVSVMWPPNSILLAALLLTAPNRWWLMLLAALPAHYLVEIDSGVPFSMVSCWFASNCCEALIGATLTRLLIQEPRRLDSLRNLSALFVCGVLVGPLLSSFLDAGFVRLNQWGQQSYWEIWRMRFLSNVAAAITVVPAIVAAASVRFERLRHLPVRRHIEGILLSASVISIVYVVFYLNNTGTKNTMLPWLLYVPLPFFLWAAVRFGVGAAAGIVLLVTMTAIAGATHQHGPFAGNSPEESAFAIQIFAVVISTTLLPLAAALKQKQHAETTVRSSEERYREIVDSQMDLICRYLPDTTLTFVNDTYCRYFRRRREDLIGHSFLELVPKSAHEMVLQHIKLVETQKTPVANEQQVYFENGSVGWQRWVNQAILDDDGQVVEFQGIGQDITERKRTEEARQNLTHTSRLALMGELTAMIAHEVNQPLAAVLSNTEAALMLLDRKEIPIDQIREILEDVRKDDLRASEAIHGLRELMRNRSIELKPIDLNHTVSEVVRMSSGDSFRRHVHVEQNLTPTLPPVLGDNLYLQHVLLNLVVNGIDAMNNAPQNDRRLIVSTLPHEEFVEVTVRDSGAGLHQEELPRIFESFFTTKPDGMGLGLSIANSIIETHRGRIWAENNRDGKGATFHFTVPIFKPENGLHNGV
jgi:two-component system sensor kinase FixL